MKLLLIILGIYSFSSFGGVNLKNGNFYINYTDVIISGNGPELSIVRTFNSKSTHRGWFGFGWGSDFETRLEVSPDGSVTVFENGSGARTRFTPKGSNDPAIGVDKIISQMKSRANISDVVAENLRERLLGDSELRLAYARKFKVSSDMKVGGVLYSSLRGSQKIMRTSKGYKRFYESGKFEEFDSQGNLTLIQQKNGYKVFLNYKDERVTSIKDTKSKQLFFEWFDSGRVKSISTGSKTKSSYEYDSDGNLVSSTDIAGNKYRFDYDSYHNMTKVKYSDDREMKISYQPQTQFVTKIVDKEGLETKYEYGKNSKNPELHYWTTVKKKTKSGKEFSSKYEYEMKKRPDGSQYTYRILTDISGFVTETTYSECCGLPLKIVKGEDVTTFEYNKRGLLTKRKSSDGDFVELDYHPELNKVTKVVNPNGWTKFSYDKQGNLYKALNNVGKAVLLKYNRNGRITDMVDYDKKRDIRRSLAFKYNALGKPTEINLKKVGKIKVDYDGFGEIKNVSSNSGKKMAVQVTQAFQSLLEIVRPAGVNLSL